MFVTVIERPRLLNEIRGISSHAPFVPIRTDFAFYIEIVQQDELPGELMVVGGDAFRKETKVCVAIALRHIAKYLVVRAVFLDDVNAMLDRAFVAGPRRDRITLRPVPVDLGVFT